MLNEKIAVKYWNARFYHPCDSGSFKFKGIVLHNNEYKPVLCGDWSGGTNPSDNDSRCEWEEVKIYVKPLKEISIEDVKEIFSEYIKAYFNITDISSVNISKFEVDEGIQILFEYKIFDFSIMIFENDLYVDSVISGFVITDVYGELRDRGYDMDKLLINDMGVYNKGYASKIETNNMSRYKLIKEYPKHEIGDVAIFDPEINPNNFIWEKSGKIIPSEFQCDVTGEWFDKIEK
jgi:hypothetical protein